MTDNKVAGFLRDLQAFAGEKYQIVSALRETVVEQYPELEESIKYGGIIYQRNNELLAGIFAYKNHVSLELGRGSELDDVHSVLEGTGRNRRHIKFHAVTDVVAKHAKHYITAAMD